MTCSGANSVDIVSIGNTSIRGKAHLYSKSALINKANMILHTLSNGKISVEGKKKFQLTKMKKKNPSEFEKNIYLKKNGNLF